MGEGGVVGGGRSFGGRATWLLKSRLRMRDLLETKEKMMVLRD